MFWYFELELNFLRNYDDFISFFFFICKKKEENLENKEKSYIYINELAG